MDHEQNFARQGRTQTPQQQTFYAHPSQNPRPSLKTPPFPTRPSPPPEYQRQQSDEQQYRSQRQQQEEQQYRSQRQQQEEQQYLNQRRYDPDHHQREQRDYDQRRSERRQQSRSRQEQEAQQAQEHRHQSSRHQEQQYEQQLKERQQLEQQQLQQLQQQQQKEKEQERERRRQQQLQQEQALRSQNPFRQSPERQGTPEAKPARPEALHHASAQQHSFTQEQTHQSEHKQNNFQQEKQHTPDQKFEQQQTFGQQQSFNQQQPAHQEQPTQPTQQQPSSQFKAPVITIRPPEMEEMDYWRDRINKAAADPTSVTAQEGSAPWSSEFFDCFNPIDTCLITYCCPCVTFSKIHHRLHKDKNLEGWSFINNTCITYYIGSWFGLTCVANFLQRTEIRARSAPKLKGDFVGDCLKAQCCACCDLIQQDKESQALVARESGGITAQPQLKKEAMSYNHPDW